MSVVIGIDPGLSGGIACLVNGELFDATRMPTRTRQVGRHTRRTVDVGACRTILEDYAGHCPPGQTPVVAIEEQSTRDGLSATAVFSTGRGYGQLEGLMVGMSWAVSFLQPRMWQKAHHISRADKRLSCRMAAARWPHHADLFTGPRGGHLDGIAEAALIGAAYIILTVNNSLT